MAGEFYWDQQGWCRSVANHASLCVLAPRTPHVSPTRDHYNNTHAHFRTCWLSLGFTSHSTQNTSYRRCYSQPIPAQRKLKLTQQKLPLIRNMRYYDTTTTTTVSRPTVLCPGLHGRAGTRKVKPIWINWSERVSGSGIICKSAPRLRQITTPAPHHSVFLQIYEFYTAQPLIL